MDTLRGNFADRADDVGTHGYDAEDEADGLGRETPPSVIDADERRMQVRAYNHWAGLLEHRNFPSIDDLEPANLPDFGPYSVLLDFSSGIDNPGIAYLGEKLALECGANGDFATLADVPPRSLLSRITDHYMQILANQAPIGFEAEFVNQRGATILYRGILLPFSSDDDTIDFIYGVINWKEMADPRTADALLLEIDQAIGEEDADAEPDEDAWIDDIAPRTQSLGDEAMTEWADGPAADIAADITDGFVQPDADDILDLVDEADETEEYDETDEADETAEIEDELPVTEVARPRFGSLLDLAYSAPSAPDGFATDDEDDDQDEDGGHAAGAPFASIASVLPSAVPPPEADAFAPIAEPDEMNLADWLAAARAFAEEAHYGEERTRDALYEAIGRAYDFSLAAANDPEGFAELLADAGLAVQERAPLTPVVKLVFGFDYDKTRLTEFAAALTHAHRLGLPQGTLAAFIRDSEGGLKGVVQAERALRRAQCVKPAAEADGPRARIAKKLRAVAPQGFDAIPTEGPEFALVMLRRLPGGAVVLVGEVPEDTALVERAAKKLLG